MEVGRGRRKLRSEDFVVVRLGKDDEVMEGETDGSVTCAGVKRNSTPSSAVVKNQWSCTYTFLICVCGANGAKRNFALYCAHIYMHLYFHRVYRVNVNCNVQRIDFLITLPKITCVFIIFLGLYNSQHTHTHTHTHTYIYIYMYSLPKHQMAIIRQEENFGNITFLSP